MLGLKLNHVSKRGHWKHITFCWIQSHKEITWNEDADHAANHIIRSTTYTLWTSGCGWSFLMQTQPFISSLWQERWVKAIHWSQVLSREWGCSWTSADYDILYSLLIKTSKLTGWIHRNVWNVESRTKLVKCYSRDHHDMIHLLSAPMNTRYISE